MKSLPAHRTVLLRSDEFALLHLGQSKSPTHQGPGVEVKVGILIGVKCQRRLGNHLTRSSTQECYLINKNFKLKNC